MFLNQLILPYFKRLGVNLSEDKCESAVPINDDDMILVDNSEDSDVDSPFDNEDDPEWNEWDEDDDEF